MTIFVDESIFPYRGTHYCHVWSNTSLDELHSAAQAVGLRREWFQEPPNASWQHYDCAPKIRALLVANGAVETDKFGPLIFIDAQRIMANNPHVIEHAWKRLNRTIGCRAMRPGGDLFASLTPEIDFQACIDRWRWYQAKRADFIEWWTAAGKPIA